MRLTSRVIPVVVLGSALGLGACAAPEPLDSGVLESVSILAGCDADSLVLRVTPFARHVKYGDEINWTMSVASGRIDTFTIAPVDSKEWPYETKGKGKMGGNPNLPAKAKGMKPEGKIKFGAPYRYSIQFVCHPGGGADSMRVLLDPDVVVDDAGQ